MHHAHHVLPADGALAEQLATARACAHVATVQDHTVHAALHANFAQVLLAQCIITSVLAFLMPEPAQLLVQLSLLTTAAVVDEVASQHELHLQNG